MSDVGMFAFRAVSAGMIVATIGSIGRTHTVLAGVVATFPVTIFLSVIVLYRSGATEQTITMFSSTAGLALVPTALALGSLALSLRTGQNTMTALVAAFAVWCVGAWALTLLISSR